MAGGLAALLDDVAALVKLTAANLDDVALAAGRASAKAAGVVVDDAAVTPQYVQGVEPKREFPIIKKIAIGSLKNKAIILVFALLLSQFIPWLLTPLLMLGGAFLCYEGAEKVIELVSKDKHESDVPVVVEGEEAENKVIAGAIRTDFILSAEIMVISLNEVASESLINRALILIVVGIGITIAVYGAVALLVKMDDFGLYLVRKGKSSGVQSFGRGLVKAMPIVMKVISFIGMLAMLWVGGHILLDGMHKLGLPAPYDFVHGVEHSVSHAVHGAIGSVLAWFANTGLSLVFGLVVGATIVGILHFTPWGHGGGHGTHDEHHDGAHGKHDAGIPAATAVEEGKHEEGCPSSVRA
ncbi:DUF808 domain-containing protein [Rothia sp. ZJ932]|uniref:DUF808 domain-containing protein n=1 Tax=Rothia sp. ZJ932 TaxID=2810516 RepID=UPI001967336B|nr:DUF808 domain-containing protein [Rothia sp. ZJ932]QRZ61277.1 DUF808 domain-containing protein [Rothia sp. ZJ932]